jgi:16S rRNA (cytosine1402-N4)-methyltransferase
VNAEAGHDPVLVKEVMHYLAPKPGKAYVDCTVGRAGHSDEILKLLGGEGSLIGIDADPHALETVRRRYERTRYHPANVKWVQGNFADLTPLLQQVQAPALAGILLDLGPSTPQLISPGFGMSWEDDQALDMRIDPNSDRPSAAEIVNHWSEEDLSQLFRRNADEKWSRRIARRIVEEREREPIRTGKQLGDIVAAAIPRKAWPPKTHPATRVFLALRIEANAEYENLEAVLPQALEALEPGGRLVVISFHSGEDARVKHWMREMAKPVGEAPWPLPQRGSEGRSRLKILTPRPVTPGEDEIRRNPRSRSSRLRAAEKV